MAPATNFLPFIVRPHRDGGWEVIQDGKTTDQLCFGEMLEMVVKLAEPATPGPRYAMKPQAEWDMRWKRKAGAR